MYLDFFDFSYSFLNPSFIILFCIVLCIFAILDFDYSLFPLMSNFLHFSDFFDYVFSFIYSRTAIYVVFHFLSIYFSSNVLYSIYIYMYCLSLHTYASAEGGEGGA